MGIEQVDNDAAGNERGKINLDKALVAVSAGVGALLFNNLAYNFNTAPNELTENVLHYGGYSSIAYGTCHAVAAVVRLRKSEPPKD